MIWCGWLSYLNPLGISAFRRSCVIFRILQAPVECMSTFCIVSFISLYCWNLLHFYCIFRWFAMPTTTCSSSSPTIAVFVPVTQENHFFFYPTPHPASLNALFAVIFRQMAIRSFWRCLIGYQATCGNTWLWKFYIFIWEILQTFGLSSMRHPLIVRVTLCLFLLLLKSALLFFLLHQVIELLLVELLIKILILRLSGRGKGGVIAWLCSSIWGEKYW